MFRHSQIFAAGIASLFTLAVLGQLGLPDSACPAGQRLKDPLKLALKFNPRLTGQQQAEIRTLHGGQTLVCMPRKSPETAAEIGAVNDGLYRKAGAVPEGAFRVAVERKAEMEPLKAKIARANSTWTPYGSGNLRAGGGQDQLGARVDNFAYDPVAKRLFAAVGTGGIFMSETAGGDVRTLGDNWVSLGERLPSQINGAVAWTSAGGGTLIAVGGEAVMGSSGYLGLGGFWSTDLGQTWNQATGIPDAALAFQAAVDTSRPDIVYAATSKGLFRSTDAGRNYVNVNLPTTPECAGVEALGPCQFTNYVTDVVVKEPGGTTSEAGGQVLAAVGFRTGDGLAFQDGRPMAPANGLYRSDTGAPGTFARIDVPAAANNAAAGFTPQNRIGHTELGHAVGPEQDHNYVYAIVQDAELFNGGVLTIDAPVEMPVALPVNPPKTSFNGLFVSADFGQNWTRMAQTEEISNNPSSGTAMVVFLPATAPGTQAWYNLFIKPDPTRALNGVPTRLTFGLEEVWQNRLTNVALNGAAQSGANDFNVIGQYTALTSDTTTHADQHANFYVPTGDGGVCLFIGGDGGVFRQCAAQGAEMDNAGWGPAAVNNGIYALLPYGLAVARDGTVWFGLQDNGSGHIEPGSRESLENFGGDGFYAEVDPRNSNIAYTESQNANMLVTTDRGASSAGIKPTGLTAAAGAAFDNFFTMDPTDAMHLMTGGQPIYATTLGPAVRPGTWVEVFNLGVNPDTSTLRRQTTIDIHGDAAYVGFCGACGVSGNDTGFKNGIATNVGGSAPPKKASPDGWHIAGASGLDNRFITSLEIDPSNPGVVYATLGGYLSNLRPPGSYLDPNPNIGSGNVFKSTDNGETFRDISGNLPHVQTNSVILSGGQLLIGTDIGAFISSDTDGTTWSPLGNGLPNVPVTMLRLRPGNPNQVFASTFGRHVWVYSLDGAVDGGGGGTPGGGEGDNSYSIGALAPAMVLLLSLAGLVRRRRPLVRQQRIQGVMAGILH